MVGDKNFKKFLFHKSINNDLPIKVIVTLAAFVANTNYIIG